MAETVRDAHSTYGPNVGPHYIAVERPASLSGNRRNISLGQYDSLNHFFDECMQTFRMRVGFEAFGAEMHNEQLARWVEALAGWLQCAGIRKGDRVALMLPNSFQYPVAIFAVLRVGAVVVSVNPRLTSQELHHQLQDSGAETFIALEGFAGILHAAIEGTRVKRILLTQIEDLLLDGVFNRKARILSFLFRKGRRTALPHSLADAEWLRDVLDRPQAPTERPFVCRDDLAFLQYTSGPTGCMRGIMFSHGNVLAGCQQMHALIVQRLPNETEGNVATLLTPAPLCHAIFSTVNCLAFMAAGGRNILIASQLTKQKQDKAIPFNSLSNMFALLVDDLAFQEIDFSNIKLCIAGGMVLPCDVAERWKTVTFSAILEGYGIPECASMITAQPQRLPIDDDNLASTGSIGLPLPSTEVGCRHDNGSWVIIGRPGEMCVRGPQVMKGYWKRWDETAEVLGLDGWLATGDTAVMDEQGSLRIVERRKEMASPFRDAVQSARN